VTTWPEKFSANPLAVMSRIPLVLYLASLALLPWGWFPPFPWLHRHAQWSDLVFATAALLWAAEHWRAKTWPRWSWSHVALGGYLAAAALSFLLAATDRWGGLWKLIGIAELCLLAVITSDLAARPGVMPAVARTVAVTAIITAVAAVVGVGLFYAGVPTRLVGTYGDLVPSAGYARAEAGTYHPNLLASFCIFAAAVVARDGSGLAIWLRRLTLAALWLTVALTFSRGMLAFGLAALIRGGRKPRRRLLAASYAAACLAVITSLTIWNLSFDPTRPLAAHFDRAPSSRRETVTSSFHALESHPLWGVGVGNLPGRRREIPFDAHLTPLNIAATMGLPALAAFVSLLLILWRRRSRPTDWALWSGLAGMALDGLASDIEDFRHVWVLFGLVDANSSQLESRTNTVDLRVIETLSERY